MAASNARSRGAVATERVRERLAQAFVGPVEDPAHPGGADAEQPRDGRLGQAVAALEEQRERFARCQAGPCEGQRPLEPTRGLGVLRRGPRGRGRRGVDDPRAVVGLPIERREGLPPPLGAPSRVRGDGEEGREARGSPVAPETRGRTSVVRPLDQVPREVARPRRRLRRARARVRRGRARRRAGWPRTGGPRRRRRSRRRRARGRCPLRDRAARSRGARPRAFPRRRPPSTSRGRGPRPRTSRRPGRAWRGPRVRPRRGERAPPARWR